MKQFSSLASFMGEDEPETMEEWKTHWVGMPEFIQEKKEPFKTLIVRFNDEQDYLDFQKRIDQPLTLKTKSIWHPYKSHWGLDKKEWHDES